ncbi:DUF1294 domain-containing protein [Actomonas aquatica]|uniref:DUF1294 domain-containing protein n=1 Tax=Actomonas aquatica TaxID=2866162 RepID=A0ABZ1C6Q8_9BACT|nr:DUF1294 domain-containing protein [Opitutus sp. WL0086]WRQ87136.1 DUF1294 domain-containing protein [Opitutus sp. WL0086]
MPPKPSAPPPRSDTGAVVTGRWSWSLTLTLGLLLLPIVLATVRAGIAQPVLIIYAVASGITLLAYAEDKRRARKGGNTSRIPELLLHLAELHGGWPGAFVGRELFRHKTQKRSYRTVYWLIVAAHLYVAIDFLLDWRLRDFVFNTVLSWFN